MPSPTRTPATADAAPAEKAPTTKRRRSVPKTSNGRTIKKHVRAGKRSRKARAAAKAAGQLTEDAPEVKWGRPKFELSEEDWEQFDKLCAMQCTLEEIAAWFECATDTIEKRVLERYGVDFSVVFARKRKSGYVSLRRAMFQNALGMQPAVQIFLAKNLLDMKDKVETSTPEGRPMESSVTHSGEVVHRVSLTQYDIPRNGYEPSATEARESEAAEDAEWVAAKLAADRAAAEPKKARVRKGQAPPPDTPAVVTAPPTRRRVKLPPTAIVGGR